MTLADNCASSLLWVSYELFADAIIKLRTRADMVAINPVPNFTTSFDSELRWRSGRTARRNIPSSAPPKTQPKIIPLVASELMGRLRLLQTDQINQIHGRHAGVRQGHDEHRRASTERRNQHAEREDRFFHDGDDQRWDADLRVVGGVNEQSTYQANQQPPVAGDEEAERIGRRLPEEHLHHRDRRQE